MGDNYLLFKWGSLKGWNVKGNELAIRALTQWLELGVSYSAMAQHDTPEQKEALCRLIDAHEGDIQNDWSGEKYTKEQAKAYIMEYNS